MAPVHSRIAGVGLLATGAAVGHQLFTQPFGAPARQPRTSSLAAGASSVPPQSAAPQENFSQLFTGLLLASAGIGASRAAGNRRSTLRASAAIDAADVPPPPPPFDPSAQVGAMAPLGFFDPLGFTQVGDEAGFRKLRASEIKHGRVAMLASVGLLVQHFIKFPGFEKAPAGFKAIVTGEGVLGFTAILAMCAVLELAWKEDESREPGNFKDPFGVKMYDDEMRNREISNGRFAMICVLGIFAAEMATGKDAIQQLGL